MIAYGVRPQRGIAEDGWPPDDGGVKSGTFNFWIDRDTKPDAFAPGTRCRWAKFQIGDKSCVICSDGPTLAATLGMDTDKPVHLFRVAFSPSFTKRHMVTVGWKKGRLRVFLDSKPVADVELPAASG